MNKSSSWQSKIDPAFDHFIRMFIEVLDALKLPANEGYIFINQDEPIYKLLEKKRFPDFIYHYSNIDPLSMVTELKKTMSNIKGSELAFNSLEKLFNDAVKLVQGMRQAQR